MATMTAATLTSAIASGAGVTNKAASSLPALGLPMKTMARGGKVRCSCKQSPAKPLSMAAAVSVTNPALVLVDERMSTEGTGLSLGLSNNLLGWILLGIFGFIWSLYFVYASSLEEDEDSGLSL
ncbi:hypothetical protein QJS10_CPB19g01115 [Acorus calamus]|uniref:PSII 6.1 kDa protein n=1 Tax=Acorus calamus TaxID=4465 RepID=A0AAV9CHT6_ACOCL|nr:hypothetical protein QJS10_CPB19g01115 [Acorus calamus]